MIKGLHHIAIICRDKESIAFYEALGFSVTSRTERPDRHDELVFMTGYGVTLELFIDPTHPARVTNPEALGLRHIAFEVEDVEETAETLRKAGYAPEEIRRDALTGDMMTFVKDPDGLPIEIRD